ncbi:MAG TPA: single-stranded DNA-binding protein [Planctomycetes bacterium]|nr:single-stranded DNA-binding protein [Planctomycetota bacterium]
MANFNKVLLMGNLTRDPETRFLPSGQPVCQLGLAVNRVWTDQKTGEKREQTCFVDCVSFGRQAETLAKYMKKGRPIFIEGRLNYRSWETQEGQKRSKLEVVVENFQFLGTGGGGRDGGRESERTMGASSDGDPGWGGAPASSSGGGAVLDDDDVPF